MISDFKHNFEKVVTEAVDVQKEANWKLVFQNLKKIFF